MNALTLCDMEYFELKTGEPITSFDPEAGGKLARPMIAMCAVLLFRRGGYQTRDDAYTAAADLTMEDATALVSTQEASGE